MVIVYQLQLFIAGAWLWVASCEQQTLTGISADGTIREHIDTERPSTVHRTTSSTGHRSQPSHDQAVSDFHRVINSELIRRQVSEHVQEYLAERGTREERIQEYLAEHASGALSEKTVRTTNRTGAVLESDEIQDDILLGTDHICGGTAAKELERYPGPTSRLLTECRQACMDNKECFFYAYWPEGQEGKNVEGDCKNNCRLYNRCSDHASAHEAIDTTSCRVYLYKLGGQTIDGRPEYAKGAVEAGARQGQLLNTFCFLALLGLYSSRV